LQTRHGFLYSIVLCLYLKTMSFPFFLFFLFTCFRSGAGFFFCFVSTRSMSTLSFFVVTACTFGRGGLGVVVFPKGCNSAVCRTTVDHPPFASILGRFVGTAQFVPVRHEPNEHACGSNHRYKSNDEIGGQPLKKIMFLKRCYF